MTNRLIQRHDQFFKRVLDQPGTADALLREWLPSKVAGLLSGDAPELMPGSFVSKELSEYHIDRLYRVRTKRDRPILIHVIVEHKSYPDRRIAVQLHGYTSQILQHWDSSGDRSAEAGPRPIPAVLSMVVYNGAAPWNVPLSLTEATNAEDELLPLLPDVHYTLVDLGRIEDAQLSRQERLRVGLLILKRGLRDGDLWQSLRDLVRAAWALGFDDLVALVRYVLAEPNEVEARILRQVLAEIVPEQEDRIMSIAAEQWKAEGRAEGMVEGEAKGRAEGEAKGKAEALMRLLDRRFGPVPDTLRSQIVGADLVTLDRWFDRALDASTFDAVFSDAKWH